ncbi:polysaccharide lyase family 1 protein [Annulohypoxylon maeteangense]|uniref:polysaccharide lyase family 1 protein n=1 Tax=Annulohypoxylon maeteangense TaxID=1927788 RepID=UPI00200786E3|nr:polysaccharide lyase family 1 protein [Annulohypoxylon maeteangense]KAI0889302.1 polysaccharide lyase family 1 protein [Annulohypoxylon maeteangense]
MVVLGSLATACLATLIPSVSALLAFPGAEGFGRNAVGGRTGSVYHVTNLNDSGTGSFRDAVSKANRIVVFDVGGTIKIATRIAVSKNIYIAGQTAPGEGITVYGNGMSFSNANDAIVRYIRFRMGKGGDSGKDGITIADGSNMIFDHVSAAWGRDETFSINGAVHNVTVQNTIIAQGLETHSCGGLMQSDYGISLFRNLYIDNKTRNPKVKGMNDFQNNVIYNWGGGGGYIAGDSAGQSHANIINNYFISGPSTSVTAFTRGNANFHGYVSENYYDSNKDGSLNGSPLCAQTSCYSNMAIEPSRFDYPGPTHLLTAPDAVPHVLSAVGANFPARDAVDKGLVAEVQSYGKKGQLISDENAASSGGVGGVVTVSALTDTDGDGIPDEWESAHGLDPRDAGDAMEIGAAGYANIEVYVNSLVPSS